MNKIIIKDEDLYSQSTKFNPAGGVLFRVGRRIKRATKNGRVLCDREKRNLLIGEVGETAVAFDYLRRGFNIEYISWHEFRNSQVESTIDLIATKENLLEKIQVKASEYGNRTVSFKKLNHYERTKVDKIIFVAVRELIDLDKTLYFECELTSRLSPRQIKMSKNWHPKYNAYYSHTENKKFIDEWIEESRYRGAKKILTPEHVWF